MSHFKLAYCSGSLVTSFLNSRGRVLLIESCTNGRYGSSTHKRLSNIFNSYQRAKHVAENKGDIRVTRVGKQGHVIDMYLTDGSQSRGKLDKAALIKCLDSVLEFCKSNYIDPNDIMLGRLLGGRFPVDIQLINEVLDEWCEANEVRLHAYIQLGK